MGFNLDTGIPELIKKVPDFVYRDKKDINILGVSIEGFRTWTEPEYFELGKLPLTYIKGNVGAGKSSIIEAVIWCLFGKVAKAEKPDRSI